MVRAVLQRVGAEPQQPLAGEIAVRLDGMRRRGLVKRQPHIPSAVMAIGQLAQADVDQRASTEEVRIEEFEIQALPIGILTVRERELGRRPQEIALREAQTPCLVATHAREARLWLRAPTIRGDGPQREFPAGLSTDGIEAHLTKHTERAQRSVTLFHAREIERIAAIQQQSSPDYPLARAHMQTIGDTRNPIG